FVHPSPSSVGALPDTLLKDDCRAYTASFWSGHTLESRLIQYWLFLYFPLIKKSIQHVSK
ncbi:MAG: hypothetical protein IIY06_03145, partial [Proteobacteria bacterium]|nr:hypothetical protein [Pseudomonadota bacterium]